MNKIIKGLIIYYIEPMSIRIKAVGLDVVVFLNNRDDFLNSLKFFLSIFFTNMITLCTNSMINAGGTKRNRCTNKLSNCDAGKQYDDLNEHLIYIIRMQMNKDVVG